MTDRVEEGDAQQAADWYLEYETAVKSVLMLGNRDPELQAVAFNVNARYIITSKLPYSLVNKTYDLTGYRGQDKLRKVLDLISRARMKANARATDQANMGTGNKSTALVTTQPAESSQVVVSPPQ